ncbi:MAG TPA: aminotransferase class III-fold pyridoxal phosphate-dependent enzyme, partial [Sphingomonadales bacterium]|nr:aminotransferase class III-fold pyridoxal phosphate-dependent enzyme [Sphingomonadales bacterium]
YSGHPIGCEVALRNLQIIEEEKLVENAATVGAYLHRRLNETFKEHPYVGEVRGRGLIAGVQLILDKGKKAFFDPKRKIPARVAAACYAKGLIVRPLPTVTSLALSPPLIITRAEVDEALGILAAALDEVTSSLSAEDKIPAA